MRRFLSIFLIALFLPALSFAQFLLAPNDYVKQDSLLRVGHLDNGLTYYIRYNANPEHRAEFYIATNAGAINETPEQRGLAHFLEHMCFNGNKDFPGNTMLSYLEKNGLIFGANVNAMTGVEQTVYTLNAIPTERLALVDTALVILANDAAYVTNDPEEVEKERGVIIEEWRSGNSAQRRQMEALYKVLFKGTKYADCNVIGDEECLKSFDPKDLVAFYQTWYHPGNQAIIVAGDVDVDYVEGKIKEFFGPIPKRENPQVMEYEEIPGNEEPEYMIFTDPELLAQSIAIIIKQEPFPEQLKGTGFAVVNDILHQLLTSMMNERLSDASKEADATFSSPGASFMSLCKKMDALYIGAMVKDNGADALGGLVRTLRQIKTYGFTQDEFERAKATLLRSYQSAADKAPTRNNSAFAMACVNNFLDKEPVADPVYMNEVIKQYVNIVSVNEINTILPALIVKEDNVIALTAPQKEGISVPTEEELSAAYNEAYESDVKPVEQVEINTEFLDPDTIKDGEIVSEEKDYIDATVLKLSNGVEVILYPTDIKKDQISVRLVQKGGKSILPEELLPSFDDNVTVLASTNEGVSSFSQSVLNKMLAGKNVRAGKFIDDYTSGVSGSSSEKDIETLMQLLYLYYTAPRCEEEEFNIPYSQMLAISENLNSSPEFRFGIMEEKVLNNNSSRYVEFGKEMLEKVSVEDIKRGNALLFGNAEGAKVFIVGDFEIEAIKPLITKYIASLPVENTGKHIIIDHNLYPIEGENNITESMKMENPNTYAAVIYSGKMEENLENKIKMSAASYVLRMRYIESLREEDGGTYSPSVGGSLTGDPTQRFIFMVGFQTALEKSDALLEKVYAGVNDLATAGPTDEELTKTKEMLRKNISENEKQPSYWLGLLTNHYLWGVESRITESAIEEYVGADSIKEMAKIFISDGNRTTILLNPEI